MRPVFQRIYDFRDIEDIWIRRRDIIADQTLRSFEIHKIFRTPEVQKLIDGVDFGTWTYVFFITEDRSLKRYKEDR